ncbi:phage tail tape measure protein [Brooklawnia cerclae]|uniref:TP901 family phage tail tape measure protein n=1 Tax=Brooklawnia cerclae TaxID=349934 RepID=A0ABX0SNV7_9ACTN|nr:phage tail tape measure protein [Brooklawnia cerclae]NIH58466.1 TP901 family phage tail tape measure protein [Brooklawnia cerclae]
MPGGTRTVRVVLAANVADYISKIAAAGSQTEKLFTSTQKVTSRQAWDAASSALLVFGAAGAGAFVAATKSAADFDAQMSKVAATGSDATSNLEALRDAAITAGADTAFSATEAADGVESLLKAGVSATDVLGGGLKGALDLAASGNQSVGDSAETAATAMTQFGLSGSQVPHIADLIAAGAGKAQGEVSDMSQALNQGGLVASQFGLSIEDTVGTLAAFASAGLIGSDAGTSFKSMLLQLANPSSQAKTKMAELGIAAYDAQGNFVGITDLAGQLKTQLSGLPQAERDAALAMIFGNDAVRAANVLYEQGADGIEDWISQVNDSGYASEAAATRMDNLSGDIEQFKGSLETLMITAGEGAQGPLRGLVGGLTDIVNFAGQSPAVAQAILLTVGAVGGLGLAAGGVMKTVAAVRDARDNLEALGVSTDGLKGKLGRLALGAAAFSAGLAVIGLIGGEIQERMDDSRLSVAQMEVELRSYASTANRAALDDSFAKTMSGSSYATRDMAAALRMVREDGGGFVEWLEGGIMGLAGMKGNIEMAREELDKLDQALTGLDADDAAKAFTNLKDSFEGYSDAEIVEALPNYAAELKATAQAAGVMSVSNRELVDWMGGIEPVSVIAADAIASLGVAHVEAGASAEDQADALSTLNDQMSEAANQALKMSGNLSGYQAALDDATAAIEANGATLDRGTEQGRANWDALDGIASAALAVRDSQIQMGESTDTINAQTQSARDSFIQTAESMGMSRDEAERLADQYKLIPQQVTTGVSTPGVEYSQQQVDILREKIQKLPPTQRTEIQALIDAGAYSSAASALEYLARPRTASITARLDYYNAAGLTSTAGYGQPTRAGGGAVWGPGTATSDSILARVSNGEYVLRTSAAERIGYDQLDYMNRTGEMPKYRNGGPVQAPPRVWTSAPSTSAGPVLRPIVQNNQMTVIRTEDDIYTAAPVLFRASARELRMVGTS